MIFDCFVSYQHDDLEYVEKMVLKLETLGLKCWYAPRNVIGTYAKAITTAIHNSKVFLLILNSDSALSEHVLNEVEIAHNTYKKDGYACLQPICNKKFDFDDIRFQEMMYYIRRRQFVFDYENDVSDACIKRIIDLNPALETNVDMQIASQYKVQRIEDIRLQRQNELLDSFDGYVYTTTFNRFENPTILDIGCGTGDMIARKIDGRNISCYVGIDKSEKQINTAREKHNNCRMFFYKNDVETLNLEMLYQYMDENGITGFDIVNISMVLLHLSNPKQVLQLIHKVISKDGVILIREIDDGINFAFPDPDHAFDRIYRICYRDEQSGYRLRGRQIYHLLSQAGFTNIKLEKQGLSTIGMSPEEKDAFFQIYFPFTLENAKIMKEKYPKEKEYAEDYLWYQKEYDEIYKRFMCEDFVFSLGFQTYSAQK